MRAYACLRHLRLDKLAQQIINNTFDDEFGSTGSPYPLSAERSKDGRRLFLAVVFQGHSSQRLAHVSERARWSRGPS